MKVVEIKTHILELDDVSYIRPIKDCGRIGNFAAYVNADGSERVELGPSKVSLTRVIKDEMSEGWCTGYISTSAKHELVGWDPMRREEFWERIWHAQRGQFGTDLMVVDVALWDIAGKYYDAPVYKLLGGFRDRVPAYMSSRNLPAVEDFVEEAKEVKRKGLKGYKLHCKKNPEVDIEVATAVREAVGPDLHLMHDPNATYTIREAIRVGRALEKLDYYWLEEPIHEFNLLGLQELCRVLEIPILTGEIFGRHPYSGISQVLALRAGDIVRNHADRGGITGAVKIAHLAEAFGVNTEPCSTGPLSGIVHAQILGAISNADFYEAWDFGAPSQTALQMGIRNPLEVKDGYIDLPQGPGLGIDLDMDTVENRTVQVM